ncbi:MAG TPA: hypothetical protein VH161_07135 [Candidatus Acidoferrales bacterium]|jgi:uncharacterized membrane protein YedE/YeeE|nr:hypothetical protein [Candidatus Acidoferrales bacterium]
MVNIIELCDTVTPMPLRSSILDNLAGDLEYHPRRGALYLALAVVAFCCVYFAPADAKFTATPLVFAFGGFTLLVKGVFLCRKSSEGIGLTESDLSRVSSGKALPSMPNLVAQLVQDFGAGPLLLWPFLRVGRDTHAPWTTANEFQILIIGIFLFGLGWVVRRATKAPSIDD